MEELLEAIRAATSSDATDEAKASGATACRTLLSALEAKPGEALAPPVPLPSTSAPDIGALVAGIRGVPVDQLLDLAIAKLRTMVQPAEAAPVRAFTVPLVAVPRRS